MFSNQEFTLIFLELRHDLVLMHNNDKCHVVFLADVIVNVKRKVSYVNKTLIGWIKIFPSRVPVQLIDQIMTRMEEK